MTVSQEDLHMFTFILFVSEIWILGPQEGQKNHVNWENPVNWYWVVSSVLMSSTAHQQLTKDISPLQLLPDLHPQLCPIDAKQLFQVGTHFSAWLRSGSWKALVTSSDSLARSPGWTKVSRQALTGTSLPNMQVMDALWEPTPRHPFWT